MVRLHQICHNEIHATLTEAELAAARDTIAAHGQKIASLEKTLQADESELKDEWQTLLVELTSISPDTVTYILPQLEDVVTMEAVEFFRIVRGEFE